MDMEGFFVIFLERVNRLWLTGLPMVYKMGMESFVILGRSLAPWHPLPSPASDSLITGGLPPGADFFPGPVPCRTLPGAAPRHCLAAPSAS